MTNWKKLSRELIQALENSGVRSLAEVMLNTKKLLFRSFLSGLFRGLGAAIGFSVLGAIVLFFLQRFFGLDFRS